MSAHVVVFVGQLIFDVLYSLYYKEHTNKHFSMLKISNTVSNTSQMLQHTPMNY